LSRSELLATALKRPLRRSPRASLCHPRTQASATATTPPFPYPVRWSIRWAIPPWPPCTSSAINCLLPTRMPPCLASTALRPHVTTTKLSSCVDVAAARRRPQREQPAWITVSGLVDAKGHLDRAFLPESRENLAARTEQRTAEALAAAAAGAEPPPCIDSQHLSLTVVAAGQNSRDPPTSWNQLKPSFTAQSPVLRVGPSSLDFSTGRGCACTMAHDDCVTLDSSARRTARARLRARTCARLVLVALAPARFTTR